MSYVLNYVESCFVESTKWKKDYYFQFFMSCFKGVEIDGIRKRAFKRDCKNEIP